MSAVPKVAQSHAAVSAYRYPLALERCVHGGDESVGLADTYGIELLHPKREGRSRAQIGRKGLSNHRWIVGVKLGVLLNRLGLVVGWVWATDNMHDKHFAVLVEAAREQMVVLADHGFHATVGDPPNLKLCQRGQWNERMLVETVLEEC
ncbi:MAG: hypothetical protein U1F68_02540 [Gammaproteobacteria bacterium]